MEWTKHKPTQDGYYWMKRGEGAKPEVMEIFGGAAQEADVFVELDDAAYEHALWYGPLTAPAESPFAPGLRALGFKQPPGGPAAVTIDLQQVPAASPRCKTCAHWRVLKNPVAEDMCNPVDQDTFQPMQRGFEVRVCLHPAKTFHESPLERNGFGISDASNYMAVLATAEEFGCVRHEPIQDAAS